MNSSPSGVIAQVERLRWILLYDQTMPVLVMSPVLVGSTQIRLPMPSPCSGSWPMAT